MAFLRQLLLYGGLIFIATAFSIRKDTKKSSIAYDNHSDDVVSTHYDIKLTPFNANFKADKEKDDAITKFNNDTKQREIKHFTPKDIFYNYVYSELNASIFIFRPTIKISLNSSNSIEFTSGQLIRNSINKIRYSVHRSEYNHETQILDLYFQTVISSGQYVLNIFFVNKISAEDRVILLNTVYVQKFKSKKWPKIDFETIETRRFFPFWDKPTMRATFNISVMGRQYKVISNVPKRQEVTCKSRLLSTSLYIEDTCTHFNTTAMDAHLVMVVLSSLLHTSTNGIHMWHRLYCAEYIKFAQRIASKVVMKFKFAWFKKLEVPELQLVAIPDKRNDIDVHSGLVLIREMSIIYDENVHSIAQKIEVARLIARGVAHQWFGNVINPIWSSHLWLNDGLAILFGIYALDAVDALEESKKSKMMDLFIIQQHESLNSYESVLGKLLSDSNSSFTINPYFRYKAPLMLNMIQHLINRNVFKKGIKRYLHLKKN